MGAQSLSIQETGVKDGCGWGGGDVGEGGALGALPQMLAPGQRLCSLLTQVGEEQCTNILTPTKCQARN